MKVRYIGNTAVSSIGLGGVHWSVTDRVDSVLSIRTIHAALDAGARLIDTALAYTTLSDESHNEDLIAHALAGYPLRDEVLVATKGGHYRTGPQTFPIDGRPATLRAHCEMSLRHLGIERLGLYQLHHPDPTVPIEESVQALADLQQEGKVGMIGVSNVSREQLDRASSITLIASVQNQFSPYDTSDLPLLEECDRRGIAYLAYSPLGGSDRSSSLLTVTPSAAAVAARLGVSIQQVVLAWILSRSPTIIPVVGARRPESIRDSLAAADIQLDADDLRTIDAEAQQTKAVK